jgi:hypothetical protein
MKKLFLICLLLVLFVGCNSLLGPSDDVIKSALWGRYMGNVTDLKKVNQYTRIIDGETIYWVDVSYKVPSDIRGHEGSFEMDETCQFVKRGNSWYGKCNNPLFDYIMR